MDDCSWWKEQFQYSEAYDICRNECENTFYVQTVKDLNLHELKSLKSIGITAGASPQRILLRRFVLNVRNEF